MLTHHHLTSTGMVQKNKKGLPASFLKDETRQLYDSRFHFQKVITLVSYLKRNEIVLCMSTLHHGSDVDSSTGDFKKSDIITFYNLTKGVDELSANYNRIEWNYKSVKINIENNDIKKYG